LKGGGLEGSGVKCLHHYFIGEAHHAENQIEIR
jgi:hypothetical protein